MFGIGVGVLGSSRGALGRFVLSQIGAAVAFAASPRKLRDDYNGPAMRVRRGSDNAELNIPHTAAGDLDEAALLAFVGSFSGFVTRMYDQSGNARDLTQATSANQPRIVNAGVIDRIATAANRPGYRTDGVSQSMATASFVVPQPFARSSVLQFLASPSGHMFNSPGATGALLNWRTAGTLGLYAGLPLTLATGVAVNDVGVIMESYFGVSTMGTYNGIQSASGNAGGDGTTGISIGGTASAPSNAIFSDVIIFPQLLSNTDRLALEKSQRNYYGAP